MRRSDDGTTLVSLEFRMSVQRQTRFYGGVVAGTKVWQIVSEPVTGCLPQVPGRRETSGESTAVRSTRNIRLRATSIESLRAGDSVLSHAEQTGTVRGIAEFHYEGWVITFGWTAGQPPASLAAAQRVLARMRPRTLGGDRDWSGSPEFHHDRRRELRRAATIVERKLWNVLRRSSTGYKFRRQHSLGPYIADFYSRDAHLVVEVDGDAHFSAQGRARDLRRDSYLRRLGLDVLRFTAHDIDDNLEGVWESIRQECRLRTESTGQARWVQAGSLLPGDVVFTIQKAIASAAPVREITTPTSLPPPLLPGCNEDGVLRAATIATVDRRWWSGTRYHLQIADASSFITEAGVVYAG